MTLRRNLLSAASLVALGASGALGQDDGSQKTIVSLYTPTYTGSYTPTPAFTRPTPPPGFNTITSILAIGGSELPASVTVIASIVSADAARTTLSVLCRNPTLKAPPESGLIHRLDMPCQLFGNFNGATVVVGKDSMVLNMTDMGYTNPELGIDIWSWDEEAQAECAIEDNTAVCEGSIQTSMSSGTDHPIPTSTEFTDLATTITDVEANMITITILGGWENLPETSASPTPSSGDDSSSSTPSGSDVSSAPSSASPSPSNPVSTGAAMPRVTGFIAVANVAAAAAVAMAMA